MLLSTDDKNAVNDKNIIAAILRNDIDYITNLLESGELDPNRMVRGNHITCYTNHYHKLPEIHKLLIDAGAIPPLTTAQAKLDNF